LFLKSELNKKSNQKKSASHSYMGCYGPSVSTTILKYLNLDITGEKTKLY
jgi:hypothetical protein